MTPLDQPTALRTGVWIDGLVPPAEPERLVHGGVTGLTSNPTNFRAAVLGSHRYTTQRRAGRPASARPLRVAGGRGCADAADVLALVFARTNGAEGFVSLEVAPELADDADGTVTAARGLWARVERPNAMIRSPAAAAGVDAIRRVTADGINVNVTLLFGLGAHAAVMAAYIEGLQHRLRRACSSSTSRRWRASSSPVSTRRSTGSWPSTAATTAPAVPQSPTPGSRTPAPPRC